MPRLLLALAAALVLLAAGANGFRIEEASLATIQQGFGNGSLTSVQLVRFYLDRIRGLNPLLRAVIEVNPDALRHAARADAERRRSSGAGGVLHGVPILLKDNIGTRDALNTTAGSLALLGSVPARDAGVVSRLRRAGAVVLGKANMDEWANFRSLPGTDGWSARGGQARNPYVLTASPCGSSTGSSIAAAASMAAVTLGTETDGSILCPASLNSVVGIKPTVGLTSRAGVVPISPLLLPPYPERPPPHISCLETDGKQHREGREEEQAAVAAEHDAADVAAGAIYTTQMERLLSPSSTEPRGRPSQPPTTELR